MQTAYQHLEAMQKQPHAVNDFEMEVEALRLLRRMFASEQIERHSPSLKLKWLMEVRLSDTTPLEVLSRRCGYSPSRIRALFRRAYGFSPKQYLVRLKMAHAMELIEHTDLGVEEIAERLGFNHVTHFSTMFRKHHGVSPSQTKRWRR